jgi:CPA1 family monovalent cation:H+ antiporter
MILFEWTLVLLLAAVLLTALAGRIGVPYPSLLALAGAAIAFLPAGPSIEIDPELALALFIAPVLMDAAFDTSPRDLKRNAVPLTSLVLVLVGLTTAVVAFIGWGFGGLPLAAAVALGAIVAPPDAAAAAAILRRLNLPRRVFTVLQGESLLNDATALLIYRFAVGAAAGTITLAHAPLMIALAGLGSVVAGFVLARLYLMATARVEDAASFAVLSFVGVFSVWLGAERAGLSAIVTTVVFGITLAQTAPRRSSPRLRVSTYSVWETAVFVLNVLAFVIMGLQARQILERFSGEGLTRAVAFGAAVLAAVVLVRIAYVMSYGAVVRLKNRMFGTDLPEGMTAPTLRSGALVSWCGMRGLVTLATAFALPPDFPGRDLIVLAAFIVVLGTLVIQGLTLEPLLQWLKFPADDSVAHEVSRGRAAMMQAALDSLAQEDRPAAAAVREMYVAKLIIARNPAAPQSATSHEELILKAAAAQREELHRLREKAAISDEAFHRLEEEIDWAELDAAPAGHFQPLTTDETPRIS